MLFILSQIRLKIRKHAINYASSKSANQLWCADGFVVSLLFLRVWFRLRKMFMCMYIQVGVSPRSAHVAPTRCSARTLTEFPVWRYHQTLTAIWNSQSRKGSRPILLGSAKSNAFSKNSNGTVCELYMSCGRPFHTTGRSIGQFAVSRPAKNEQLFNGRRYQNDELCGAVNVTDN